MKKEILLILIILVLLAVVINNWPQAPSVVRTHSTDTLYRIDTVRDTFVRWKKAQEIRDTVYITKTDTVRCWEFAESFPDSAKVSVYVCSDSLPEKPKDLTARIDYSPSPFDSVKYITRTIVHEVKVENKPRTVLLSILSGIFCGTVGYTVGSLRR